MPVYRHTSLSSYVNQLIPTSGSQEGTSMFVRQSLIGSLTPADHSDD